MLRSMRLSPPRALALGLTLGLLLSPWSPTGGESPGSQGFGPQGLAPKVTVPGPNTPPLGSGGPPQGPAPGMRVPASAAQEDDQFLNPVLQVEERLLGPLLVVGDSNSTSAWFAPGWVEMLEALLVVDPGQVINVSVGGAMAMTHPVDPGQKSGAVLLAQGLATGLPYDGVILSLGTNDVLVGAAPETVLAELQARAFEVQSLLPEALVFVALVPPVVEPVPGAATFLPVIETLNGLIVEAFGAERVIDFYQPFVTGPLDLRYSFFNDGLHHNSLGMALKAHQTFAVLAEAFELDVAY
jgi:lysophospholipase L1-like esterase